jgi:hypothetical protein
MPGRSEAAYMANGFRFIEGRESQILNLPFWNYFWQVPRAQSDFWELSAVNQGMPPIEVRTAMPLRAVAGGARSCESDAQEHRDRGEGDRLEMCIHPRCAAG